MAIDAGGSQSFFLGLTPTEEVAPTEAVLQLACDGTRPVTPLSGLNTLLISADDNPVLDVIALASTPSFDGVVRLSGPALSNAFAISSANVGATADISVSAESSAAGVVLSLCETDSLGQCVNPPAPTAVPVATTITAGATPTFSVFVTATETVPFDAAANRIAVRFTDVAEGVVRGASSVAVATE